MAGLVLCRVIAEGVVVAALSERHLPAVRNDAQCQDFICSRAVESVCLPIDALNIEKVAERVPVHKSTESCLVPGVEKTIQCVAPKTS